MFSMTGYGKACKNIEGRELTIELKAVNHRFLDLNIKMPRIFNAFEDLLRKIISGKISRGHVDVYVNFMDKSEREKSVQIDVGLAKGYVIASQKLNEQFNLTDDFTLTSLMRTPDVLKVVAEEVEVGNEHYTTKTTFLAGDIVADEDINIYDLSAVVSYLS